MATIIYDKTAYHSVRDYILQALDPDATFQEAIERGEITRENAHQNAWEYLLFIIGINMGQEMDEDDWRAATMDETDLEAYLLGLIEEAQRS